jgi:hypothetical protein
LWKWSAKLGKEPVYQNLIQKKRFLKNAAAVANFSQTFLL